MSLASGEAQGPHGSEPHPVGGECPVEIDAGIARENERNRSCDREAGREAVP